MGDNANTYSADPALNRASWLRADPAFMASALADPASRAIPIWRGQALIAEGAPPSVVLPTLSAVARGRDPCFLGLRNGSAIFLVDLSDLDPTTAQDFAADAGGAFVDLRLVGASIDPRDAGLLGYGRGLSHWHGRQRYCGVCGAPTHRKSSGHVLTCADPACATSHFPRTDPAAIVLVASGDRCLLGRQPQWPPGMYSTLAGFIEPGESLEDAVRREVREESGVTVGSVYYHSSQPWPFPQSLMFGCYAVAVTDTLHRDDDELEDVRWFSRQDLATLDEQGRSLPRGDSIARRLIELWIARRAPV